MKGVIIENSLTDTSALDRFTITRSWNDDDWRLHEVEMTKEEAQEVGKYLSNGPWYVHFWNPGEDDVLVIFKDKTFWIKHSDKTTWNQATAYGLLQGIPEEQLDFVID